jgi:hypothetical protein
MVEDWGSAYKSSAVEIDEKCKLSTFCLFERLIRCDLDCEENFGPPLVLGAAILSVVGSIRLAPVLLVPVFPVLIEGPFAVDIYFIEMREIHKTATSMLHEVDGILKLVAGCIHFCAFGRFKLGVYCVLRYERR